MATADRLGGKKTLKVVGVLEDIEKDEVKKRVDIITLFASFGVSLAKAGKGYKGRCPWHEDATPSLSVDAQKGLYNCFGCGESGDVVTLVEKMKGFSFREAMDYLKKESFGGAFTPAPSHQEKKQTTKEPQAEKPPLAPPGPGALSLREVNDYYQKRLLASKEALAYLKKRGLENLPLLGRFGVGYADGSLLAKVTAGQKEHLKTLGLLNEHGYEHFNGCITVPLYEETGTIVELYGRKLTDQEAFKHLYSPGGHKGLCNAKATKAYEEVILTESILDGLSLLCLGVENVLPLYGTNGFTPQHLAALKTNRVKTVTLALNGDEPGRRATEKLKVELLVQGFLVKVVFPPTLKDWNEELVNGLTKDKLAALLAAAEVFKNESQPTEELKVEKSSGVYVFSFPYGSYRLAGVKEEFVASLKVNVLLSAQDKKYIDNLELYSARSRTSFANSVSKRINIEIERIENDLLKIVEYLEAARDKALFASGPAVHTLSEEERALGMELLSSPRLFELIVQHMEALGYVGEELNKILIYLSASSRKMDDPISLVILSESAAGKSYLIDTVKKLLPEEEVISLTSLSDQALNYLPAEGLLHKFLVMGEAVHNEVVEHQLREMLSSKELSRLVTVKDEKTGAMQSKLVVKKVVVSCVMSSTDYELNAENLSRCFLINTDESLEQTKRIHTKQREKYSIQRHQEKKELIPRIIATHQAAQRLLKKRLIVNPLTKELDFPATLIRARRDHERFMDLIAAVCFLRQYQKEEQLTAEGLAYIECDAEDYRLATQIMKSILPLTLTSFPKSALTLYEVLRNFLKQKAQKENLSILEVSATQRELREAAGLSQMFVKRGLRLLVEYEYLKEGGVSHVGLKKSYKLIKDVPIELVDISQITDPEKLKG